MHLPRRLIPLFALALAGCAGTVRRHIFLPDPLAAAQPSWSERAPLPVEAITADALRLRGLYWAPCGDEKDLIIYFHGNGGNYLSAAAAAQPLAAGCHGLLVASYRGYGGNPGQPSEKGLRADAAAFLALGRRLVPGARIYLFGHSLGAAVAIGLAERERVSGVITLGAFASLTSMAPVYAKPFLPDRFDNRAAVRRLDEPLLLIHGSADQVVPFAQAEALKAAAPPGTRLMRLNGAGHAVSYEALAPEIRRAIDDMRRLETRTPGM